MLVKLDHLPRDRGEHKKTYVKPPPSIQLEFWWEYSIRSIYFKMFTKSELNPAPSESKTCCGFALFFPGDDSHVLNSKMIVHIDYDPYNQKDKARKVANNRKSGCSSKASGKKKR